MDKYSAIWLSHSTISTFRACPRAYYLTSIYKDPRNHHKVTLINPSLALGSVVHEVLESLSLLPVETRFQHSLIDQFHATWTKVSGAKGGFESAESEAQYHNRGEDMLRRVMAHPGPLTHKAVKIKGDLPYYWFSASDNLILCGKLDWLEYLAAEDGVHIIDFKTGVGEESEGSLQLPIYHLLAHNCQTRPVIKASYWYINRDDLPTPKPLPDLAKSQDVITKIGKEIKLARALNRFKCPGGSAGCRHCLPFEKILQGQAQYVGESPYGADIYTVGEPVHGRDSEIL